MKSKDGYVEDKYIDFVASNGYILRNSKGDRYETFIPQYDDVDLGDNLNINIKGYRYRYKDNKNDINKLNVNGIPKYLQNDKIIELIKDSIIDSQKNTNLENFLNSFKDNKKKLRVGKNLNEDENKLISNILSKIFDNNNKDNEEIKKIKQKINDKIEISIQKSSNVANKSSELINLISGTNLNANKQRKEYEFLNKDEKTNKYIIKKDHPKYKETQTINLKEKKDNFNEKHDFNFFDNILCDFYNRDKYNSLGTLTFDFVDKTIDKEKLKENKDMNIKLEFLNGGTSSNSHEQFVIINNDGTNNGISMDKEHFAETNKSIKLKSIIDNKNNDEELCSVGGMKKHKSQRKRSNNSCHYVPNMVINNKENNSENRKYSFYEKNLDNIAFAILAAGKVDGSMAKELDKNSQLVPIKIKITINGVEHELFIKDIIPNLKELEGKELENKFSKLYDMAIIKYSENFNTYYDEEKDKLYYSENPSDSIKKKNILSHIINSYNINNNDEIEPIELSPDDINLHYSSNNELDNKFKSLIYNANEDELLN
ncbi:hypothetical protein LY90DRAFT_519203 [Neocallimastix californiae]|uniref:Uncharacterized protein n=1 Tax=Neocallimastix californiae TaxID=1754190 RepID=A0A1Y1Z828_9FUNG|nr:hypothetical protein LY90DRAFT_519203 [Neocallimastix californiae]|eukprot:ORY06411.1 hypothetical protein LY90DRAFT_519203 [Neocallimastix californiae]